MTIEPTKPGLRKTWLIACLIVLAAVGIASALYVTERPSTQLSSYGTISPLSYDGSSLSMTLTVKSSLYVTGAELSGFATNQNGTVYVLMAQAVGPAQLGHGDTITIIFDGPLSSYQSISNITITLEAVVSGSHVNLEYHYNHSVENITDTVTFTLEYTIADFGPTQTCYPSYRGVCA